MKSTLRGGGVGGWLRRKLDVIRRRGDGMGGGGSECSGHPIFIFFIKGNWICPMTRYHAESNINMLSTRNPPVDSGVRQCNDIIALFVG